jgi:ribosome-associated translation inhibitor RaiA
MRAHVTVSSEKHRKRTEIVVYWRDNVFTAVGENADLTQSVATAASKVQKQGCGSKKSSRQRNAAANQRRKLLRFRRHHRSAPNAPRIFLSAGIG